MEDIQNKEEVKNINTALAENLGTYMQDNSAAEKNDKLAQIDYKMVTFSLAGKDYAIDIMKVKEIAKAGRFTYVPNTLPFVLGVYNLRGEIIPIVDLRLFFNIEVEERTNGNLENMLIVSIGEQTFGIVVDFIDKVVGIQKSTIQPPHPLFGDINIKYIQGVVEVNNRLYILLDIERIFGSKIEAQSRVEETQRNMMARAAVGTVEVKQTKKGAKAAKNAKAEEAPKAPVADNNVDMTFVKESLAQMRRFTVSEFNEVFKKTCQRGNFVPLNL